MQRLIDRLNRIENLTAQLIPVVNQFFGETVTVSGLLMAQDIIPVLKQSGVTRCPGLCLITKVKKPSII
jgi:hypothetical protein